MNPDPIQLIRDSQAQQASKKLDDERLAKIIDAIGSKVSTEDVRILGSSVEKLNEALKKLDNLNLNLKTDNELKTALSDLGRAVSSIEVKPIINVPEPAVTVNEKGVDLSPIIDQLKSLEKALKAAKTPTQDNSSLEVAIRSTTEAINGLVFPTANYVLPFANPDGDATQVVLSSDGKVPVSASIDTTGLATSTGQDTGNASLASIDSKITAVNTDAVVLAAGTAAFGKLAANSGVDIGDVTVNNTTSAPVFIEHSITSLGHGVKTVTTAGTDVALASSTACKRITIQAQTDNTGLIAVGGTGVDATEATGTGVILYAGDIFELETDNLADVFIDATVSGEGVRYTYFN